MLSNIRWMLRRDMTEVLSIENSVFEYPWLEEDFINTLRERICIGMVYEKDVVLGYMIYELHKKYLNVINFAVHPDHQKMGIGTDMISKLTSKLSDERRNRIQLHVRESDLSAQLFFKSQGFKCISVFRDYYTGVITEEAYLMRYAKSILLANRFQLPENKYA